MAKEKNVSNAILKNIILIFTVAVLMVTCINLKPLHVNAASKPVSKVYCCLYKSGKLVISQKKIKPQKGKKVLENKKLARPSLLKNHNKIKIVYFRGKVRPKSCEQWFMECKNITKISNIKNLDTSQCTNTVSMFWGCRKLKSLDVSRFNTAKVKDMSAMFYRCKSLKKLDVSKFKTSKVKFMYYNGIVI